LERSDDGSFLCLAFIAKQHDSGIEHIVREDNNRLFGLAVAAAGLLNAAVPNENVCCNILLELPSSSMIFVLLLATYGFAFTKDKMLNHQSAVSSLQPTTISLIHTMEFFQICGS